VFVSLSETRCSNNTLHQNKYEEETGIRNEERKKEKEKKERRNNIWWAAQIMKLLSVQFSPVPCYRHPLRPNVSLSTLV
jgi:hypothetical protein